jgi:hypothetical protein
MSTIGKHLFTNVDSVLAVGIWGLKLIGKMVEKCKENLIRAKSSGLINKMELLDKNDEKLKIRIREVRYIILNSDV